MKKLLFSFVLVVLIISIIFTACTPSSTTGPTTAVTNAVTSAVTNEAADGATKKLLVSNTRVAGDYTIGREYTEVTFDNVQVDGIITFENAKYDKSAKLVISGTATIGGIIINRSSVIENSGEIGALIVNQPTTVKKSGAINYVVQNASATMETPAKMSTIANGKSTPQTGFMTILGKKYYAFKDNTLAKGYVDVDGKKHYFNNDGSMLIKGKIGDYYADYDGTLNHTLTGIADLDAEVSEIISEIITENMTEAEKLWAVYIWPRDNTKYRIVNIEYPAGVIDTKEIYKLAQLMIENRKGSCEYYAAVSVVLFQRLGYKSRGIAGVYLDKLHAWSQVKIDGTYYNFDSGSVVWETEKGDRFFKKTNEELKSTHVKGLDNLPID